jgi:transposase
VQAARRAWSEGQPLMDIKKLVFIDETWTSTSMTRRYGRAPRGRRCIGSAPHGHWKTSTFVGGLRHHRLTAPMVADGPMDGQMFLAWVRQFLCPTLKPGDIVVVDNLSSHKVAGVEEAINAAGATLLYLPPYSPDLNPIEKLFAKLKVLLRKAARRTINALWREIGRLLDTISPDECENYFASSGYVYTYIRNALIPSYGPSATLGSRRATQCRLAFWAPPCRCWRSIFNPTRASSPRAASCRG